MKILYFTYIENPLAPENAGVMRGQVINILTENASKHLDDTFHWLAIINTNIHSASEDEINNIKAELNNHNVHLHLHSLPKNRFKWNSYGLNTLKMKIEELKPDIVHCRVYPAAYLAVKLKNKTTHPFKIIFDARGVYPEQILERSSGFVGQCRYHWWKHLEKSILKAADLTTGVTEVFVDHFKAITPKSTIKYIPCAAKNPGAISSEEINTIKNEAGYTDHDIIAVYSGNLSAKYSSINYLVNIFSNLYKLNNNFKLLVLSKSSPDELNTLLEKEKLLDKVQIYSLKPQEVYKYLSIAHIGLLFREESIVNRVAMPTKFAEYLFCGLPVIISTSIAGIARIVEQQNLGIVLSSITITESAFEKLLSIKPETCKQAAEQFSVENVAGMYYQEYLNLQKSPPVC